MALTCLEASRWARVSAASIRAAGLSSWSTRIPPGSDQPATSSQAVSQALGTHGLSAPLLTGPGLVDVLLAYLNRGDLLHDLQETVRQLRESPNDKNPSRSVTTIKREGGRHRKLSNRLTEEQVQELVAAFEAGQGTRLELAERYGIGRTSVASLLRQWRKRPSHDVAE